MKFSANDAYGSRRRLHVALCRCTKARQGIVLTGLSGTARAVAGCDGRRSHPGFSTNSAQQFFPDLRENLSSTGH
jgi:hypothetical protein